MSIDRLARAIAKIAQNDGAHPTGIAALGVFRLSVKNDPMPCFYELGLAVVAQGSKQLTVGDQMLNYGPGQSLLTTIDLPVIAQITRADLATPYLGLLLKLDARHIMQLAAQMDLPPLPREQAGGAISICPLDPPLLDALIRLLQLLDTPELCATLAPLIQQEILVRLLSGPHGPYLRQLVAAGSPSHQIAQAMNWLRQNFAHEVRMDELAARVHMSPSTFRLHFRKLTGMSPLQYQKQMRLQEARLLMLNHALDAGSSAQRVGYESASQFSRDYSRLFGAPPQRDIQRMRRLPAGGA